MPARVALAFGPFQLDPGAQRLLKNGEPVALSARQLALLSALVSQAGDVLSKDQLIAIAWPGVAVTDNSLEQAISTLRRTLGSDPVEYIRTEARRGYRFAAPVARVAARETDAALDALLAPHRAWIEGRAALETLERDQVAHARAVFERLLATAPDQAPAHVGLANACVMQYETTRADEPPDRTALEPAAHHAREACRLDPSYGEAWATLAFVLDRTGQHAEALAAARRAVTLEPDNWRHHLRLGYIAWGEERLRAAGRTLALVPGFPMAEWLAATVHVARNSLPEAARALDAGIATAAAGPPVRFSSVALHWLRGLLHLAGGDEVGALASFERELSTDPAGQLYARECAANTWYAIGALHLRRGRLDEARSAFTRAVDRVPGHRLARMALTMLRPRAADRRNHDEQEPAPPDRRPDRLVDAALGRAAALVLAGRLGASPRTDAARDAARVLDEALAASAPGSDGWLIPVEPVLQVQAAPEIWAPVLARLRARAV